jgi:hypothetical protein
LLADLEQDAIRECELTDFGPSTYRGGFERFLQSLGEDARLPDEALGAVLANLRRLLCNRLQIEAWLTDHPEVTDVPVEGPVAITGIPRSGTTALADMMSLDPGFRPLRGWEQMAPCPPPVLGEEADDPRRVEAARGQERMKQERPEQMAMHLYEVDATTEDTNVLALEGRAQNAPTPVTGYHIWWRESSMTDAYHYHYRVAQLLHSRRPPTSWLFKSPHMSFHLEDFVEAYPDARFVLTHRDPVKAVPSWVSFVTSLFSPGAREVTDPVAYGRHLAAHLAFGAERSIEARKRLGGERFLDVHHHEFVADPMGTIERIYGWLGRDLTSQVRDDMVAWEERNRSGSHGQHRYTLEQFGLEAGQLRQQFAAYIDYFDVRLEA